MKRILLASAAILAALGISYPAAASLGGTLKSVQADRAFLRGTIAQTGKGNYSVEEIKSPNGVVVREYVSSAGNVFGVAWQGPTRPDLRQVLGPYFETFTSAVPMKMRYRLMRGPFRIKKNGLVVEMGGHTRWLFGRAYVKQMTPAGVTAGEIR